ncbi:hypothetical protein [Sedimentitalea arenosa]|jgi:hypothetical protein|uniref:DUF4136 domain-containing protein n=1 Tax=Sedimentitalea arenosa TaxID=2798803 RepID=A0A8J7LSC3_9RHOB|nr:hypothetical protein [Arenibacterium arenosum]MBJ6372703.1 hypothetical protein [Arenibacterium arenosum]
MIRILALLTGLSLLAACNTGPQDRTPSSLGEFKLGHNIVVADKMRQGPISRDATAEEWEETIKTAVQQRFGGFDGDQLYHFGISVEGYMLAPEGFIYNPRSMLIINVTVWDDAAGKKLNDEVYQITVVEDSTVTTFFKGSGRERSKQEQMDGLTANALDQLGDWLEERHKNDGWFDPKPETTSQTAVEVSRNSALFQ